MLPESRLAMAVLSQALADAETCDLGAVYFIREDEVDFPMWCELLGYKVPDVRRALCRALDKHSCTEPKFRQVPCWTEALKRMMESGQGWKE